MCKKKIIKPYIIRNGGWVTPQLDNILEKAILDQLVGQRHSAKPYIDIPSIHYRDLSLDISDKFDHLTKTDKIQRLNLLG